MNDTEKQFRKDMALLLRMARQRRRWTQARVAKKLGITVAAVSHMETGRRLPIWPMLFKLERVLGFELEMKSRWKR